MALWTPADINPGLWLDAQDTGTLVLVDGLVSQWSDKSGNNRHVTQASASLRPSVTTVNGKQMVQFSGSKYLLGPSESVLNGVSALSVFVVIVSTSTTNNAGPVGKWGNGVNAWIFSSRSNSAPNKPWFYCGASGAPSTVNAHDGATNLLEGIKNVSSVQGWVNGGDAVSAAATTVPTAAGKISIGSVYGSSGLLTGSIAEVIICPNALARADRESVEGYLAHKWNFTSRLPSGHPYIQNPPGFIPVPISGVAKTVAGAGVQSVLIRDWITHAHVVTLTPDPVTGEWSTTVNAGQYDITYLSDGCAPICHGPYTMTPP